MHFKNIHFFLFENKPFKFNNIYFYIIFIILHNKYNLNNILDNKYNINIIINNILDNKSNINIIINNILDNKYNINIIMHNNKYIIKLFIFRDWWNSLII